MDAYEAVLVARGWFDDAPGLSLDLGFELVNTSRFDFREWEVECCVFSTVNSEMVKYMVIISDDEVMCARRM